MSKKNQFIDLFCLFCIGAISLGYVMFNRPFAELNIQLPFLDFPIFIGEILLFLCLCLFLLKGDRLVTRWHYWVIGYFVFVLFKALWGYLEFGPLALRNAALFYYPIFVFFAYSFSMKGFLYKKINVLYIAALLLLISSQGFREPWIFTCFVMIFILSYAYPVKAIKYISLGALLLVTPYKLFFATSRMMMVANFVAGIYVAVGIYFILNLRKSAKAAIAILGVLLVGGMLIRYSDKNALTTLLRGDLIVKLFIDSDKEFRVKHEQSAQENQAREPGDVTTADGKPQVRIYNPNPKMNFNPLRKDKPAPLVEVGPITQSAGIPEENALADNVNLIKTDDAELQYQYDKMEDSVSTAVNGEGEIQNVAGTAPITQSDATASDPSQRSLNNELVASAKQPVDFNPSMSDQLSVTGNSEPVGHDERTQESSSVQFYNPDPPLSFKSLGLTNQDQEDVRESPGGEAVKNEQITNEAPLRDLSSAFGNARFRLFIWRDMFRDLGREKPIFGFSFGRPFRSITLETLMWGSGDWQRDGWIAAHNSFIHMIYRAGIIGLLFIGAVFITLFRMIKKSIRCRSLVGFLLCGIIINWFVAANFLVTLELPYTAIPIWTLFGLTYAYVEHLPSSAGSVDTGVMR